MMARPDALQSKEDVYYHRKDSRKYFVENQVLSADCETVDGVFKVSVQDLSPSGAFITTDQKLSLGQEIAMTILLPNAREFLKATGEIVRVSAEGIAVKFNIIFND